MAGAVAYLGAQLALRADDFNTKLKGAHKEAKAFNKTWGGVGQLSKQVGTGLVTTGGLVVGAFAAMAQSAATYGDELAKTSQRTGVSVQGLAALSFAAGQAGSSWTGVQKALKGAARSVFEASQGVATYKDSFDDLGISVVDSTGKLKNMDELIPELADSFANMENGTRKAALAQDIFGRTGVELIPLLNQGAEGLATYAKRAEELGLVITDVEGKMGEDWKDALDETEKATETLSHAIGFVFLPAMIGIAEKATAAATWLRHLAEAYPGLIEKVGKLALLLVGAGGMLLGLSGVIAIAPAFAGAITVITGPIGIAFGVVSALVAAFILWGDQIKAVGLGLLSGFTTVLGKFIGVAAKAANALGMDGLAGKLGDLERSLEDTGEEWKNTAADMWEGKETADDTEAALINLNAALNAQPPAVADAGEEWDRFATDLKNISENELYKLGQAIEDADEAIGNAEAPVVELRDALAGNNSLADALDVVNESALGAMAAIADPNASLTAAQQALADDLGGSSGSIEKTNEWGEALTQISTIVTDFGADLAGVILKGGTFKEVMTGAFESVATVILRLAGEQVMGLLLKNLGKLIGMIPGLSGLGSAIGGFFSGAAAAAPAVAATAAATAAPAVAATAAAAAAPAVAGAGASAAGAGAMGVMGPIGAGAAVAGAASSIIANFQFRRMNKSLSRIEESTRYLKIQTVDVVQNDINKYWPYMLHTKDAVYETGNNLKSAVYETGAATVAAIGQVVTAIKQQKTEAKMTTINQFSFADEPNEKLFDLTRNERRVMA